MTGMMIIISRTWAFTIVFIPAFPARLPSCETEDMNEQYTNRRGGNRNEINYLKQKEESDRDAALLAEVEGEIAGTAGINSINAAEKTRHRASFGISIAKAWWGLGIGRALTEACIECARAAGYLQLELEVVAGNRRAEELYKSVGFVEYGRNPKGFRSRNSGWQENVLMRLELQGGSRA